MTSAQTPEIEPWLPDSSTPLAPQRWDLLSAVFGDPEMCTIFSQDASISAWLAAERALARAERDCGVITEAECSAILTGSRLELVDREELWRQTRNVGYPILPLVRMIAGSLPPGPDGRVHYGATTQDIMDTGLALQLSRALDRLAELLERWGETLAILVEGHTHTVMAARTHAQQAVPTTLGAKLAVLLAECSRHRDRLYALKPRIALVSLYGAGGTSASFGGQGARVRVAMGRYLGLACDTVPWHVARDGVGEFGLVCAMVASTAGRFAREVIELSRTEIGELSEPVAHHRGASSTMPQKRNPISSEAVVGMAGVCDSLSSAMLAAMRPVHERAAGEWQVEWVVVPELACMASGALVQVGDIGADLQVFPERMQANLSIDGALLFSEAYMMQLAPRLGRETAHDIVYEAARRVRESGATLAEAVRTVLKESGIAGASLPPELPPIAYVGDAELTCREALRRWTRGTTLQSESQRSW